MRLHPRLLRDVRPHGDAQVRDAARGADRRRRDVGPRRGGARAALEATGMPYELKPGDGAFYGPKIDFDVRRLASAASGSSARSSSTTTRRSGSTSTYVGEDNAEHRPVVIHRAVSGSFERFIAILIEHFAGAFPAVARAGAGARAADRGRAGAGGAPAIVERLARRRDPRAARRAHRDARTTGSARARCMKVPYMAWSASARRRRSTVAVRARGAGKKQESVAVDEFIARVRGEIETPGADARSGESGGPGSPRVRRPTVRKSAEVR